MSILSNDSDALLYGLSDFWLKFFADSPDLSAMYEGTQFLFGQAYLNLMTDVLGATVEGAPLFRKEYFKALTVRGDQLTYDNGEWVFPLSERITRIPFLKNKVYAATAALEEDIDYTVTGDTIRFKADPTLNEGFAVREVVVATQGYLIDERVTFTDLVRAGMRVTFATGTVLKVAQVEANRLLLVSDAPVLTALSGVAWSIEAVLSSGDLGEGGSEFRAQTTAPVSEIAYWAIDAAVDDYTLFYNFGHYFSGKKPSSEPYRAFVRGLMQLYLLGPAIERIESALNVYSGLPVIREDGETFVRYERTSTQQLVYTDKHVYAFPLDMPMRPEVLQPPNETVRFSAFQPLTLAVMVTDYISDPEWWHRIIIPQNLFHAPVLARAVSPQLAVNKVGHSQDNGWARIGDPGFYVGADEDGVVPGVPEQPIYRHRAAFLVMDKFLKMHLFGVTIHKSIEVTGVYIDDLLKLLRDIKPTHTNFYVRTVLGYDEIAAALEEFKVLPRALLNEFIGETDNHWRIGARPGKVTPRIGFAFYYGPNGPILCAPGSGTTNFIVGGLDPTVEGAPQSITDFPVRVSPLVPPTENSYGGGFGLESFGSVSFGQ